MVSREGVEAVGSVRQESESQPGWHEVACDYEGSM